MTNLKKGIAWELLTCFCFAVFSLLSSSLTKEFHFTQVLFFKNFLGGLICFALFFPSRGFKLFKTKSPRNYIGRGLCGCLGTGLWLYTLSSVAIEEATAINFTIPFMTTIIAWIFFKESLRANILALMSIGFLGVLLIIKPGLQGFNPMLLVCLLTAFTWALGMAFFKQASNQDQKPTVLTLTSFTMALITVPFLYSYWQTPSWQQLFVLSAMALFSVLTHFTQLMAFQHASLAELQPFGFSRLLFIMIINGILGTLQIDLYSFLGSLLIFYSALLSFNSLRGKQMELKRT